MILRQIVFIIHKDPHISTLGIPIEGKRYCLLAFQIQNSNICLNFTPGE